MNQCANWTNIAVSVGMHSTTAFGVPSVPTTKPTCGYGLLTTSTAAIIAAVWSAACVVQKASCVNSREHKERNTPAVWSAVRVMACRHAVKKEQSTLEPKNQHTQ